MVKNGRKNVAETILSKTV